MRGDRAALRRGGLHCGPTHPPTFASSDWPSALARAGVRVPADVAVPDVGDARWRATCTHRMAPYDAHPWTHQSSQPARDAAGHTGRAGPLLHHARGKGTMRVLSQWRPAGQLVLLAGLVTAALARGAPAQTSTGSIRGYVTDSAG